MGRKARKLPDLQIREPPLCRFCQVSNGEENCQDVDWPLDVALPLLLVLCSYIATCPPYGSLQPTTSGLSPWLPSLTFLI